MPHSLSNLILRQPFYISLLRLLLTKYYKLGSLNNRNVLFHSSGGWKHNKKVWAGLVLRAVRKNVSQVSPAPGGLLAIFGALGL